MLASSSGVGVWNETSRIHVGGHGMETAGLWRGLVVLRDCMVGREEGLETETDGMGTP